MEKANKSLKVTNLVFEKLKYKKLGHETHDDVLRRVLKLPQNVEIKPELVNKDNGEAL